MSKIKAIPEGYHTVTPYLIVDGAEKALEFYKKAFNATIVMKMPGQDGRICHSEIRIGDSPIMLADEFPEMGAKSPVSFGGSPVTIHLYMEDVDQIFKQAIAAGATEIRSVQDQFYGDRSGVVRDPFGHTWYISTHIEDVSDEETRKRFEAMSKEKK